MEEWGKGGRRVKTGCEPSQGTVPTLYLFFCHPILFPFTRVLASSLIHYAPPPPQPQVNPLRATVSLHHSITHSYDSEPFLPTFLLLKMVFIFFHHSPYSYCTMLQARRLQVRFLMRQLHFFNLPSPSSHSMALGLTQPLNEMSTTNLLRVKDGQSLRIITSPPCQQLV
jgi:hypothetical protein